MDTMTLLGALGGIVLIGLAIGSGSNGDLILFLNAPAMLIVFGGTVAATMIAFPSRELSTIARVTSRVFSNPRTEVTSIIRFINEAQERARSGGYLALEGIAARAPWPAMKKGLQLVSDGADNETLLEILAIEQKAIEEHHRVGQRIFQEMAKYSPAFGMLGTLVGLVKMLSTLDDPETIGPKMAIALLTTFYGLLIANLLFLPMVTKLERRSKIETLQVRLMMVGLASINKNDTMMITREKMGAFLAREASGTALDRRRRSRDMPRASDRRRTRRAEA
jgi:chemotaxis protein MotA